MIRFRIIISILGSIIKGFALLMIFPLITALIAKQYNSALAFTICIVASSLFGFFSKKLNSDKNFDDLTRIEGIAVVVSFLLSVSLAGAIPYIYLGMSPIDAFFESISGFTTTGATIISDFTKFNSSLYWYRSYTQWLGGMGIMVLFVAVMPHLAISGRQLFYAETSSASKEKLTPRIADTARHLWSWYCLLTIIMIFALMLVGMPANDAVSNSFSTLAAGGFSPNPQSIMGYNNTKAEWIIIFFMFLAGANFMLQVKTLRTNKIDFFKNPEFRLYTFLLVSLSFILAVMLFYNKIGGETFIDNLRIALFQNISITTTTGSATANFDIWPEAAKAILVIFMMIGGCSGSAGGGIKVIRVLILLKYLQKTLLKNIYPQAVITIQLENRTIKESEIHSIITFIAMYFMFFFIGGTLVSIIENNYIIGYSGAIATLGNIGPGFAAIGPMGSFADLSGCSKLIFSFLMWAGRLEIMAIAIFMRKEIWQNASW